MKRDKMVPVLGTAMIDQFYLAYKRWVEDAGIWLQSYYKIQNNHSDSCPLLFHHQVLLNYSGRNIVLSSVDLAQFNMTELPGQFDQSGLGG